MKFVFLLYINRSGSTFLSNELSKMRDILICPEAEILVNQLIKKHEVPMHGVGVSMLEKALTTDRKLKYWGLNPEAIQDDNSNRLDVFFTLLKTYHASTKPDARIILFKAVDLMHYIDPLLDYCEKHDTEISFLILLRDPRGIYNSQRQTYVKYRRRWMNRNPLLMLYQWQYLLEQSINYADRYSFFTLRFEDLVIDLGKNMKEILAFLGIPADLYHESQPGDLKARMPSDQLYMHPNIEDSPYSNAAYKWNNELRKNTRYFIEKTVKAKLKQCDYPLEKPEMLKIVFLLLRFRFKSGIFLKNIYTRLRKIFSMPV